MINERNETGIDPLVSDAYGELAKEKTPDSLNQSVLRMATRKGKTPYSMARAWMRPAAWAATIGLSLAVVLQLTNLPEADLTGGSAPSSVPLEEQELATTAGDERQEATAPAKRSRPQSHQPNGAGKVAVLNDAPAASAEIADAGSSVNAAAEETPALETPALETQVMETHAMETRALETQALDTGSVASVPAQDEDTASPALAPRSTSVIQQSGERSRLQAGSEPEPVVERKATTESLAARTPSAEAYSAGVTSLQAGSNQLCPDEARESAEKWSECITALEDTFPQEFIDREIEEFRKSFPEFERDTVDK